MIKSELDFEIHEYFVDWFETLQEKPTYSSCWREGFKRGMSFNANTKQPIVEDGRADGELQELKPNEPCPACGWMFGNMHKPPAP